MSDNVIPLSEGMRQRLAVRRAMGAPASTRRAPHATPCARHGCPHVASEHADIRVGDGPYAWGACRQCRCAAFLEVARCDPAAPYAFVSAASGMRYELCRCGAVRAIARGVDAAEVAWTFPDADHLASRGLRADGGDA